MWKAKGSEKPVVPTAVAASAAQTSSILTIAAELVQKRRALQLRYEELDDQICALDEQIVWLERHPGAERILQTLRTRF